MSNYLVKTPITFCGAGDGRTKVSFDLTPSQINNILKDYVKDTLGIQPYPTIEIKTSIDVSFIVDSEKAKELFEKTA